MPGTNMQYNPLAQTQANPSPYMFVPMYQQPLATTQQ